MPVVSKAQFDRIHVLHAQGKITDQQFASYVVDVHYDKLPEHAKSKEALAQKSAPPPRRHIVEIARKARRR